MIMGRLSKVYWMIVNRVVKKGKTACKAQCRLYDLRAVVIMPLWWYRALFWVGMALIRVKSRVVWAVANWLVHRVPLQVRYAIG
jgi:hypothetical protein